MTDNEILAAILAAVLKIEKNTRDGYDLTLGGEFVVDASHPHVRGATANATKTIVVNLGPEPINIYESDNVLARQLAMDETWESPTNGAGQIKVDTDGPEGSTIHLTTFVLN